MNKNSVSTESHITDYSIFRIGKVVEIIGQSIKVKVDIGKNTSFVLYKGEIIQNISVGGYVKIKKGFEEMIGIIEGESVSEETGKSNVSYGNNREKINRILNIKILGFIEEGDFKRGIKELPLIDNTCFLLTKQEFNCIHKFYQNNDIPLEIGKLEHNDGQKIELGINSLFASHIGIFGNTGSGKSYTLAKIYRELFKKCKDNKKFQENSKFFLIDFNGEYIGETDGDKYISKDVIIEEKYKNIYTLTTNKKIQDISDDEKFPVHEATLNDSTFWSIFLEATEKTQMPFLNRAIKDTYIESQLDSDEHFVDLIREKILSATSVSGKNIDRNISTDLLYEMASFLENDSLKEVANYFRENLSGGNENIDFHFLSGKGPIFREKPGFIDVLEEQIKLIKETNFESLSQIKKIGLRIIIKYYDERIRGFSNKEHLSPLIKRLDKRITNLEKVLRIEDRIEETKKNFTIISLRNVNLDIRKMIPMLLTKELYDHKKRENNKDHSLHIIIDEAHNILSRDSNRESEQWKDYRLEVFEEIIKEGRKFGTFLTISSQRPSDISSTIISQLHNYFLHRLINNSDLQAVGKTIAYLDKVSADSISNLPTGTCVLAGLVAQLPVVMRVNEISKSENQTQSQNIDLLGKWEIKN